MLSSQVISVTDLRTNTAKILDSLRGVKYIFVNNKPKSVIMDIKHYEKMKKDLAMQRIVKETEEAIKHGRRYKSVDEFMKDLLE